MHGDAGTTLTGKRRAGGVSGRRETRHILYRQAHQGKPLAPQTMYDLLMRMLLDNTHPSVWNAGYITGWYLAKYQAGDTTVMNETLVNEGAVQFKGECLHWPFTLREE